MHTCMYMYMYMYVCMYVCVYMYVHITHTYTHTYTHTHTHTHTHTYMCVCVCLVYDEIKGQQTLSVSQYLMLLQNNLVTYGTIFSLSQFLMLSLVSSRYINK